MNKDSHKKERKRKERKEIPKYQDIRRKKKRNFVHASSPLSNAIVGYQLGIGTRLSIEKKEKRRKGRQGAQIYEPSDREGKEKSKRKKMVFGPGVGFKFGFVVMNCTTNAVT